MKISEYQAGTGMRVHKDGRGRFGKVCPFSDTRVRAEGTTGSEAASLKACA